MIARCSRIVGMATRHLYHVLHTVNSISHGSRLPAGRQEEIVADVLARTKLADFRKAYPRQLSGGMKQRVAIARAMAMSPKILLMDEPFASLDALTRRRMQDELLELWDEWRMTILFVTHSIEEAIILGSRILVMTPHPGRVRAELNAHDFAHDSLGGEEFQSLNKRISNMLFHHMRQAPNKSES